MIWKEGTGSRPWRCRLYIDGRDTQRSFRTKGQAEEWERHVREQQARAKAGLPAEQGPITFEALTKLYLEGYSNQSKPWLERMLAHSRTRFGNVTVRHLRSEAIGAWIHTEIAHLKPKTRQHILTAMRQVLNAGVEWGYLSRSPARSVRTPTNVHDDENVDPFATWAEVLAVADAIEHYSPLVRFACSTGLRPGEWSNLRWRDIDVPSRTVHVRGTKTQASLRAVALSQNALDALGELARPLDKDALVFTTKDGKQIDRSNFRTVWSDALATAKLKYRPPYQMRHTYATLALGEGVTLEWIGKQMGHKDISVTRKHYARFTKMLNDRMIALLDKIGKEDDETNRRRVRRTEDGAEA